MAFKKVIAMLLCIVLVAGSFAACTAYKETPQPTGKAAEIDPETELSEAISAQAISSTTASTVSQTAAEASENASSTTAAGVTVKANGTVKSGDNTTTAKGGGKTTTTTTTQPQPQYIDIVLLKNRKAKCSSPNVSLATGEVEISASGYYRITQNTGKKPWHGQITLKLKNTEKAELRFENVNISNDTPNIIRIIDTSISSKSSGNGSFVETEGSTESAIDNEIKEIKKRSDADSAPNVQISFPEKTSSSFSTSANSVKGVIYNESKLIIKGHGKAYIKSETNANNCICSTKSIKIRNVNLNLTTAQNANSSTLAANTGSARGFFSYSGVTLESGYLNVKTNGDAIRCDDFESLGGTAVLTSSACDAIDADDSIVINGGAITATALDKSSFKVRRINNTEKYNAGDKSVDKNDCVRSDSDTFKINGGTVRGESKKITTVRNATQPVITCKLTKETKKSKEEEKVAAIVDIKGVKKSSNKCTKFLYSSSGIKKNKKYTGAANGKSGVCTWNKSGTIGTIEIISSRKTAKQN